MAADSINSVIRRASGYIDTSGAEPPRGLNVAVIQRAGVYTQNDGSANDTGSVLGGQISLGIIAAFVLGAVVFYVWTKEIQGGG